MSKFNENDFEQKLFKLKDSHDSIASLSSWCLSHVEHHGKIVSTWLGALKKVKMDHRILLFYLANDIIQYSKKKGLAFVGTFAPALQKATTMVRDPNIKNKILRIFKIWDERNVYDESFLVDLSSLLTRGPKVTNRIDLEDFQPTLLYSRLKSCQALEEDTDGKMKLLVENKMPLTDTEKLRTTLKNRKASEDVIAEIDEGIKKIGAFISALEAEIKERTGLIDLLDISEQYYEKEFGEAKIVSNAYKCFTNRVKTVKKKLDDKITTLPSPVPTPSPTAPSPEPEPEPADASDFNPGPGGSFMDGSLFSNQSVAQEFDNFYGRPRTEPYSPAVPFNGDSREKPAPLQPPPVIPINMPPVFNYFRPITDTTPPPPPPRPPAEPVLDQSTTSVYNNTYNDTTDISNCSSEGLKIEVISTPTKDQSLTSLLESMVSTGNTSLPPPPVPPMEFGWDNQDYWESPESPPIYEKEGMPPPVGDVGLAVGADVDMRSKDVDHRNLISLTGGVEQDWDFPPAVEESVNEDMELSDEDVGNIEDVAGGSKPEGFPILPIKPELNNKIDQGHVKDVRKEPEFKVIRPVEGNNVGPPDVQRAPFQLAPPPPPPLPILQPQVDEANLWNPFPPPPVPPFKPPGFQGAPPSCPPTALPPVESQAPMTSSIPPLLPPGGPPQDLMNISPGPKPRGGSHVARGGGPDVRKPSAGPQPLMSVPTRGPAPLLPPSSPQGPPPAQQTQRGPSTPHRPPTPHGPSTPHRPSTPHGPSNLANFEHPPPPPPPFAPAPPFNRFPPMQPPPMPPQDGLLPNPVPSFDSKPPGQPVPNFDTPPSPGPQPRPFPGGGYRQRFDQRQMGGQPFFRGSPYRSPGHQYRPMRHRFHQQRF